MYKEEEICTDCLHCGGGGVCMSDFLLLSHHSKFLGNKFLWQVVEVSWWHDARVVQTDTTNHCLRTTKRKEAGKKGEERLGKK